MRISVRAEKTGKPVYVDLSGEDRIRDHSPDYINDHRLDEIIRNVQRHGGESEQVVSHRIEELEKEWNIDRAVIAMFAAVGSMALLAGANRNRKWLYFLGAQLSFLGYHAAVGWCPPVSLLRRLGFRTTKEIDAEKYALKTLRGDFREAA
jgi:hypothetical protein